MVFQQYLAFFYFKRSLLIGEVELFKFYGKGRVTHAKITGIANLDGGECVDACEQKVVGIKNKTNNDE